MSRSCFDDGLARLAQPECLVRLVPNLPIEADDAVPIAFYGLNARELRLRREHLLLQLQLARAADVTVVHCADVEDLASLGTETFRCLHPFTADTRWTPLGTRLALGTVSLTLKHMIAMKDMLTRGLPHAVVLEDDAILAHDFNSALSALLSVVPHDAHILHVGSYHRCRGRFSAYRRANTTWIVGTVGQVYFARGARRLIGPVVGPPDVQFSSQQLPISAPSPTYVPSEYLVWPAAIELGLGSGTHSAPQPGTSMAPTRPSKYSSGQRARNAIVHEVREAWERAAAAASAQAQMDMNCSTMMKYARLAHLRADNWTRFRERWRGLSREARSHFY